MVSLIFILISAILFILLINKIQLGFACVIALRILILPIARFQIGPLEVYFTHITTFLIWVAFLFYISYNKDKTKPSYNKIYTNLIILFLIGNIFIIPLSLSMGIVGQLIFFIKDILVDLSLCYVAWYIYNSKKDITIFIKVSFVTMVIASVYGLYCYSTMSNPYVLLLEILFPGGGRSALAASEEIRAGLEGRVQSTMYHPITWGGACILFFFVFYNRRIPIWKVFRYILLFLLAINSFLSGSRTVLLVLFGGIVMSVILSGRKEIQKGLKYVLVGGCILVFLLPILHSFEEYRGYIESAIFFWDDDVSAENKIKGSSLAMRLDQLEATSSMIKDSPIGGLGHGYVVSYQQRWGTHPVLLGFESIIFQKTVDGGFLGLFLWFLLFWGLYKMPNKIKLKSEELKPDIAIVKSYVIAYFIFSIFTGFMSTFSLFIILYILQVKSLIINNSECEKDV